jgi:hypothetical protein
MRSAFVSLNKKEVKSMGGFLMLSLLVLIGPLAVFFGVDSRVWTDRGWFGARR